MKNKKYIVLFVLVIALITLACGSESNVSNSVKSTKIPTSTVTFLDKSYRDIRNEYDKLTDLQKEDYLNSLKKTRVQWSCQIDDVRKNGTIYLNCNSKFLDTAYLEGLSTDILKQLNKDQIITFDATINSINTVFGTLSIWLEDPNIISIQ